MARLLENQKHCSSSPTTNFAHVQFVDERREKFNRLRKIENSNDTGAGAWRMVKARAGDGPSF